MTSLLSYRGRRTLGLITARGGSKGIPRKNIKKLLRKPLIAYTIEAAQASRFLTRCIVSTDDPEIARISRKYGADVPFMRPAHLADDRASSMAVVQHALEWLRERESAEFDYLMILQPTSPLRTAADIDACIRLIVSKKADSVMSIVELPDFSFEKVKRVKNGLIIPAVKKERKQPVQRHVSGAFYKRNCAIYLTKVECLLRGDLFGKKSVPYIMPRERSVDINEPADFNLAEFWMKKL